MAATAYHGRRGWFCFFVELRSYLNYLVDGQMQQKIANSYDLQVSRLNDSWERNSLKIMEQHWTVEK